MGASGAETESVDDDDEEEAGTHDDDACEDEDEEEPIQDDDLPNYYEYEELFPQLQVLKTNYDVILEELRQVHAATAWPDWPEKHYIEGESEWRVFPFCYTFPSYDATKTTWVDHTTALCPRTAEILRNLPGIRTALFSKLGPNTILAAHRGWADLSNHILRCHLALTVPTLDNGKPCCAMVVGGEVKHHEEREVMVFDDSKLHYAFNHSADKTRFVLIVDLYRPDHLPRGRATGGRARRVHCGFRTPGLWRRRE
jgi:aspartyl/asparaginyl beta-hydroxylase (cupin superfamily)